MGEQSTGFGGGRATVCASARAEKEDSEAGEDEITGKAECVRVWEQGQRQRGMAQRFRRS